MTWRVKANDEVLVLTVGQNSVSISRVVSGLAAVYVRGLRSTARSKPPVGVATLGMSTESLAVFPP